VIKRPPIATKLNQFALFEFDLEATDTQMKPRRFITCNDNNNLTFIMMSYLKLTNEKLLFQRKHNLPSEHILEFPVNYGRT